MTNNQSPEKFATITLDTANNDRQFPAYQLSINAMRGKHSGHGYRLMGPKYAGRSKNLRTVELAQRDADKIRAILDEVFPPKPADVEPDAIHRHFGLSYANYLVLPRTLLQSMPDEWQARFVALLDEMDEAFAHVPQAEAYKVEAATEHIVNEMAEEQLEEAGIEADWYDEPVPEDYGPFDLAEWRAEHEKDAPTYHDRDGNEVDPYSRVLLPTVDPVPHYNRGRTRIEPRLNRTEASA